MRRIVLYVALAIVITVAAVAIAGKHSATIESYDTALKGSPPQYARVAARSVVVPARGAALSQPAHATAPVSVLRIARSANLTIYVSNVERAAERVEKLAHERNGDVLSSDLQYDPSGGAHSTAMETRVPASRFFDYVDALATLGSVKERSVNSEDKTAQIVDGTARLHNLQRTERDIRAIMDRSGSIGDVLSAETQLSNVREQIETLQAELDGAKTQVAYSTVTITVLAAVPDRASSPTAVDQLANAWQSARVAFVAVLTFLGSLGIWMLVFSPFLGGGYLAWRLLRRRSVSHVSG